MISAEMTKGLVDWDRKKLKEGLTCSRKH